MVVGAADVGGVVGTKDTVEGVTVVVVDGTLVVVGTVVIGAAVVGGIVVVTDSAALLPSSLQPEATSTAHKNTPTHRSTKPPNVPLTRRTEPPGASLTRHGTFLLTNPPTDRSINPLNGASTRRGRSPPLVPLVVRNIVPACESLSRRGEDT